MNSTGSCNIKKGGIKIVENFRKDHDIFNTGKVVLQSQQGTTRIQIIKLAEKFMDEKIRSFSPYMNGRKNVEYLPQHLNSSVNLGSHSINDNYNIFIFQQRKAKKDKDNLSTFKINPLYTIRQPLKDPSEKRIIKNASAKQITNVSPLSSGIPLFSEHRKHSGMFARNEKNQQYSEKAKKEKLHEHQKIIDCASLSLIANRKEDHQIFIKQVENSKSTFDDENFVMDHARERVKIKNERKAQAENTYKRKGYLYKDQRIEIVDYYDMNDQLIQKNNTQLSQKENDLCFKNMKKINTVVFHENQILRKDQSPKQKTVKNANKDIMKKEKRTATYQKEVKKE